MKLWRITFALLAAFSLASCSSDDDDKDIVKEILDQSPLIYLGTEHNA